MFQTALVGRQGVLCEKAHKVARALTQSVIPCAAVIEVFPRDFHQPHAVGAGADDGARRIRRTGVDHDDLRFYRLREQAIQLSRYPALRVERGDNYTYLHNSISPCRNA